MTRTESTTGVIAVVNHRWGTKWMTPHHVLTRLARNCPTVWLEPPTHWREVAGRRHVGTTEGLEVLTGPVQVHRLPGLTRWLLFRRLDAARRILTRQGGQRIVVYVWHPRFVDVLDWKGADAVVYHVEDEYTFSDEPQPIPPDERRLLEEADHVFFHSPPLYERKGPLTRSASRFPNGVDFWGISRPAEEPEDLRDIPSPRVGYAGWLKKQVDWGLVDELARRRPGYQFVFVGGRSPHPSIQDILDRLEARENCHFLGAKPTEQFQDYPPYFDVCIMPYVKNYYTQFIYPLKLHEYMASGNPLISSPIPAVEEQGDLVSIADGVDEWLEGLDRAVQEDSEEAQARRRERAREHDWAALVARALPVLEGRTESVPG